MCVFSTASALFMFPAMYLYYKPALELYRFEKADGIGCSYEIVVQGFIRFASIALFPVVVSVAVIYLLVSSTLFQSSYCEPSLTQSWPVFAPYAVGKLWILWHLGIPSSTSCQRCPEPNLDSSSHCPHLCLPWPSIPSVSGHCSRGRILQWFLYTHWCHALGVSIFCST